MANYQALRITGNGHNVLAYVQENVEGGRAVSGEAISRFRRRGLTAIRVDEPIQGSTPLAGPALLDELSAVSLDEAATIEETKRAANDPR